MDAVSQIVPAAGREFRLYRDLGSREDSTRVRQTLLVSAVLHVIAIVLLPYVPIGAPAGRTATTILARFGSPAKLVAPPAELTQKAPNTAEPAKEFDLEGLLPRPPLESPAGAPSTTRPAARVLAPPSPPVADMPALPAPPKLEGGRKQETELPMIAQGSPVPPGPPQIQATERPKLAFERPGAPIGASAAEGQPSGSLRPPSSSISEVGRELARGGVGGGLVVGDLGEGIGGIGEGLNLPPSPGRIGSSLELLSDPMGVDFRPYLITILSAVRRNWFAVMPESAKLGRRGKVVIQFAVSRDGSVPKLVIASPSGTQAFDRAAVAGISASNPFPPLPADFKGLNVRLQFVFLYNLR